MKIVSEHVQLSQAILLNFGVVCGRLMRKKTGSLSKYDDFAKAMKTICLRQKRKTLEIHMHVHHSF